MTISLERLNTDPRYRKMTLGELTDFIGRGNFMTDDTISKSDWDSLRGNGSGEKACNLIEKWASEGKQGMVCEWAKQPGSYKEYFKTSCGENCDIEADEYNFKFCPYCGKTIKTLPDDK
jgi:hypothetical protein